MSATTGPDAGHVAVEARTDPPGLTVTDRIEQRQYALATPSAVDPVPAATDPFVFPVDDAVAVETARLRLPTVVITCVRDGAGDTVARTEHDADVELPAGRYDVELHAPIRLYLAVEGRLRVVADGERTTIDFGEETRVTVGVRSEHERPAATVETTSDPADLLRAVSTFGSALKTTSPERAFPTFRGHPPAVELADELSIPDRVGVPDAGVTLEVPATYRGAYVAAPLAYYLGATVEPADSARLVTDRGFEHPLGEGRAFEREVERLLKQVFVLDCVTRTEGLYEVAFKTRERLEGALGFDPAAVYDAPVAERLETYLAESYETVAPAVPDWKLTSHVALEPSAVETLPYLVNDLAVVRTPTSTSAAAAPAAKESIDEFLRDASVVRSTTAGDGVERDFVEADDRDALEHAWVGEETPVGMSKATETAYQHQFDREPTDGDIDITVVCNDAQMAAEQDLVRSVYGSRDRLPFAIEFAAGLTTEALRATLADDVDFLHYVGHIDDGGFRCTDGLLDARALETVGVDAFLLNACQSYEQGLGLVEAGAVAGITTLSDVPNEPAVEMGYAVARLLNCGFPLQAALEVATEEHVIGNQYNVIGDGGLAITQAESGTPVLLDITHEDGVFEHEATAFPTHVAGMGGLFTPFIGDESTYYLNSGRLDSYTLERDEVERLLACEELPVRVDGDLYWSFDLTVEDIVEKS